MLELLTAWWAKDIVKFGAKVVAAALVAFGVFKSIEHRGATKEKARVEKIGAKTNAKAQAKREAAEQRPDITRWYRD